MVALEDLISIALICVSLIVCTLIFVAYFERKHKADLEYDKKRQESEADTVLMKAKIYADKDLRIANLENSVLSEIQTPYSIQTGTELDQYMPLIQQILQHPDLIKPLLDKIGLNQPK